MKILVIGANGRTGLQIATTLKNSGYEVIAGVHSPNHIDYVKKLNLAVRKIDLIDMTVAQIAQEMTDIDTIVFASGAPQTQPELAMWIDLDGAAKTMQAAQKNNIKRFIMLSAAGAENRKTWDIYDIPSYYLAKYYAEDYLKKSGLIYTIIRPAILTDDIPRDKVGLIDTGDPRVSRSDVASVVLQAIENSGFKNTDFNLYFGNTDIDKIK
ncbi:NAD(P)-binding oxidoreductase [Companilactobacillus kimchiensis]|uniref:NAD(P)-binding domain-containing protein n=1 Tax=Companilactobacillus kimchiensis TaxID=993692 RepID=A0A0R2L8G5_9LACO|nr:NAD(P)-binding oxidoreductase [Companilactobacillus kimchiensis]KRN97713.1 hypothetical protein IV57_GL001637 [Companilactobacillus kimchiensis]